MTATYEAIASTTVSGSSVASIVFSSISGSYTDLVAVCYVAGVSAGSFRCYVGNGSVDTGSNYSRTSMYARRNGANNAEELGSARSSNDTHAPIVQNTYIYADADDTYSPVIANFMNYSNTTTYKTILTRHSSAGNSAYRGVELNVSMWRSTSAINKIEFYCDTSNLAVGTNITLYGIKAE